MDKGYIATSWLQQRRLRITFHIVRRVIVVILIFVLFNSFYYADVPSGASLRSDTTTAIPSDINYFRFQPLPSWGSWQLDGHTLTSVPLTNQGTADGIPPLAVAAGRHVIRWQGDPFPALTCTFVVPYRVNQPEQTCHITELVTASQDEGLLLAFPTHLSFQLLSQEQRQKLIAATQAYLQTLTSTTTVGIGERYRYNSTAPMQSATQPMQATLSFLLDTNTRGTANCQGYRFGDGCSYPATGEDCRLFCTIQWADNGAYSYWNVAVVTRPTWIYTPSAVQHSSSQSSASQTQGDQQITSLRIDWKHNQWQVTTHLPGDSYYDDPNCGDTIYRVSTSLASKSDAAQPHPNWNFTSAHNRALGCLATTHITNTSNIAIIQRFNVLQAVNAETHKRYPGLPLINIDGESLALRILNSAAFIS